MTFALLLLALGGGFTPGSGSSSGYSTVQDESAPLTQRSTINFTGAGVSCVDSGGITVCTVSGGGGGGGGNFVADAFGFTGGNDATKAVTAAWATGASNIVCAPYGEEESVEDLHVVVISRGSGTFTVRGYVPNGAHSGTMNFHCTGN